jgi:plasmid stabilization system protein ParE
MAKRKIVWSHRSRIRLFEILDFYVDRNKSNLYSKKLYSRIIKELALLAKQSELGVKTEVESVRGLIIGDYIIFYQAYDDMIVVHNIWDSRRNPEELKII